MGKYILRHTLIGIVVNLLCLELLIFNQPAFAETSLKTSLNKTHFNIPQQDADVALTNFGKQADISVIYRYDLVQGKKVNGINGAYSVQEAINLLLEGTGLAGKLEPGHLVILKRNNEETTLVTKRTTLATIIAALFSTGAATQKTETPNTNENSSERSIEVIQVSGIRTSLKESMSLKKDAPSIQDSIVAEDLGKFPDQNVAESLQRISGVSIDRTNGEGSKITVRGLGPQFNEVRINGRTLATTERGREFDFQALPSELISGADVVKASRANIAEGSLGAYVNINTARPLNKSGFQAAGSAQAVYNDIAGELGQRVSAIVSNTFADDTFGILVGFAYNDATNRIDSAATNRWFEFNAGDFGATFLDGTPVAANETIHAPGRAVYSIDQEERERVSANVTLQWQQDEDTVHTFDFLYSDLSRQADSSGMQVPLQGAASTWRDVQVTDQFTLAGGTRVGQPIDGLPIQRGQDSDTFSAGLNSIFYRDKWRIETDFSYSKAKATPVFNEMTFHYVNTDHNGIAPPFDAYNDDPQVAIDFYKDYLAGNTNYLNGSTKGLTNDPFDAVIDGQVVATNGDFISIDNTGDILNITQTTVDFTDPAAVRSWWTNIRHEELEDEVKEAKLDLDYEIESGVFKSVEMGLAYTKRTKTRDVYQIANGCRDNSSTTPWLPVPDLSAELSDTDISEIEALGGTAQSFQQFVGQNTFQLFNTCQNFDLDDALFSVNNENFLGDEPGSFPRQFTLINDIEAFKAAMGEIRNQPVGSANDWTTESIRPSDSVKNEEENTSIYAQVNMEGESNHFDWSGNIGLRYVKTDSLSTGSRQNITSIEVESITPDQGTILEFSYSPAEPTSLGRSYNKLLPSFNLSMAFNDNFFIKTAGAKVITRPAIEDTGVNTTTVDQVRLDQYFTTGNNPFLNPYEADQFDLSFEYYSDKGDAYSLGFFYKDISSFISTRSENIDTGLTFPTFDNGEQPLIQVATQPSNRPGGTVRGFELAGLHFFDYLPGIFSGFGIQGNYTYTQTEDELGASDTPERQNVKSAGDGLEGFSENSFNLIAFYDKDGFQARLAYNWREGYLKERTAADLRLLPKHVDDYGQFDFSTSYDVSENITIRGEVINLTNENIIEFADIRERVSLIQYTGRRYQLGLTAKF